MKVMITAVGQRTEHWTDLFHLLAADPDLELTVLVSDVSAETIRVLRRLEARQPRFRLTVLPAVLAEHHSGHMASIVLAPGALRAARLPQPDVLHLIGEASYLSTRQILRWRGRRWPDLPVTLYAAQNLVLHLPRPFPTLEQRSYAEITQALPITPAARNVLRSKGFRGPATRIPLGVDCDRFTPRDRPGRRPGRLVAGFVGRFEVHKGLRDLVTAAELCDCDLVLVGGGSLTPELRAAAGRRPGKVRIVDWTGHDDLPGLLAGLDVLVLPSVPVVQRNVVPWIGIPLAEQFGRVLVEAMACGIPVIGSDVGEIGHVIGAAGITYQAGDPLALAGALIMLRDDPTEAVRLGRLGRRRAVAEFSWHQVADRLKTVWAEPGRELPEPDVRTDPLATVAGAEG